MAIWSLIFGALGIVWPRCGSSVCKTFHDTGSFGIRLCPVCPTPTENHQPLLSLCRHLWCHCKHKLCPQMKDQPGFMPLWGQTNSKYGQAMTWIMRLSGHYGGRKGAYFKENSRGMKAPFFFSFLLVIPCFINYAQRHSKDLSLSFVSEPHFAPFSRKHDFVSKWKQEPFLWQNKDW